MSKDSIKEIEVDIINYEIIKQNKNLLIVFKISILDENKNYIDYYEVFKVQFIGVCETKQFEKKCIVAFYIGELGMLQNQILNTEMPNGLWFQKEFALIDYKSYCEINGMIGERNLSLKDYIKSVFNDSQIHNCF